MNSYNNPATSRPWWKTTPAALGGMALVALIGGLNLPLGFIAMIAAMVGVWVLPPWRWFTKLGATFSVFILLTIGAGVGGQLDDAGKDKPDIQAQDEDGKSATSKPTPTQSAILDATDYTGTSLDEAEAKARSAGFTTARHDAAEEGRAIVVRSGWTVCFQKADTAAETIDFAAVKTGEPCPTEDGGTIPWPRMPDVVEATYATAVKNLKQAGIDSDHITLDDVYLDVDAPTADEAAEDGDEWRVCFQSPDKGTMVTSATTIHLDLGRWTDSDSVKHCPQSKDTTYKIPANDPDYDDGSDNTGSTGSTNGGTSSSSGGTTGGNSVGTVHPGSFCSPAGATGVTTAGTPMVCGPASDGRNRWHS